MHQLSELFENVVATDSSKQQLSFAPKLPNIRYHHLPSNASADDIQLHVAPQGSVDLITVAQALHWFDLPVFYDRVRFALRRRPHGVFAAWCYTEPRVDEQVDVLFWRMYNELAGPFWAPERKMVDDEYRSIEFPFDPVEGMEDTGPVEFVAERAMDLDTYFTYLRSWSAYQTAKKRGFELLSDDFLGEFERAWGGDRTLVKVVRYPVFLRIGKVRD